ncbi:MAG: succinate dehydrogenase assembly factor 2 [Pseudomonadota bacterium]
MEDREDRLRKLKIRSWRRGTREMDLVLGRFGDQHFADMSDDQLDAVEALMAENDVDIITWINGQVEPPADHQALVAELTAFALKNPL